MLSYHRFVRASCPHPGCGSALQLSIDDPADISAIPQVGEKVVCPTCKKPFLIGSEELSP